MLRDAAVAEVQLILGRRSDLSTEIISALRFAQEEREKPGATFPWWLLKEDVSLPPLTIGSQVLALPADFIQENEKKEGNLRYRASATTRTFFLTKMTFEEAEKHYFGSWLSDFDTDALLRIDAISPGTPKSYVLRENSIQIYPTPNAAYVLVWSYWGKDTVLDTNIENGWLKWAPWVLIADAAIKIGATLNNAAAVGVAQGLLARAEPNMFRSIVHRQMAARSFSMGSRL